MILGFSTGCLYKTHGSLDAETFSVFKKMGCNAIELMWHDVANVDKLFEIKKDDLAGFEYVSIHAPAFDNCSGAEIVSLLEKLALVHEKIKFDAIVLHPYETMNWEIFKGFDLPFVIENMDWRKEFGKYVESMENIFSKLDVPMVLDLNHCFTNDPSMLLASDMIEKFEDRIKEIHLSGFESFHEPLFITKQEEILKSIPDRKMPIIIESGLETIEDAKKEFEYIKQYLLQN